MMEIELAEQRRFVLQKCLTLDDMQQRTMDRRMNSISSDIADL